MPRLARPGTRDARCLVSLTGLDAIVDLELLDAEARRALFTCQADGDCILIPLRRGFVGLIAIDILPVWDRVDG